MDRTVEDAKLRTDYKPTPEEAKARLLEWGEEPWLPQGTGSLAMVAVAFFTGMVLGRATTTTWAGRILRGTVMNPKVMSAVAPLVAAKLRYAAEPDAAKVARAAEGAEAARREAEAALERAAARDFGTERVGVRGD